MLNEISSNLINLGKAFLTNSSKQKANRQKLSPNDSAFAKAMADKAKTN